MIHSLSGMISALFEPMLYRLGLCITIILCSLSFCCVISANSLAEGKVSLLSDPPLASPEVSKRNNIDFLEEGSTTLFPVAIIDSGVDYTHKDLAPFIHKNLQTSPIKIGELILINDTHGWDFNENDSLPFDNNYSFEAQFEALPSTEGQSALDSILSIGKVLLKNSFEFIKGIMFMGSPGHGSHVSGIVLEQCQKRCSIVPIKVFGQEISSIKQLINALEYVEKRNYKLVNLSLGIDTQYLKDKDSIEYQHLKKMIEIMEQSKDILFVVAAGNNGNYISEEINSIYPAILNAPNIITVGAINNEGELASFSNFNPDIIDVFAPGVDILSTWNDGEYKSISGTSMSTPYITGLLAYIWDKNPKFTPETLKTEFLSKIPLRTLSFKEDEEESLLSISESFEAPVVLDSDKEKVLMSF